MIKTKNYDYRQIHGKKFGKLFIVSPMSDLTWMYNRKYITFMCDCGRSGCIPEEVIFKRIENGTAESLCCGECVLHNSFLKGIIFGDFTILDLNEELSTRKKNVWTCKCNKCGQIVNISENDIFNGDNYTCINCSGPKKEDPEDYIWRTFGLLRVLDYDEKLSRERQKTVFRCICNGSCGGKIIPVELGALKAGQISCGCTRSGYNSNNTISMIGKVFNGLTVKSLDNDYMQAHPSTTDFWYICECEYNHLTSHRGYTLRQGSEYCEICYPKMKPKSSSENLVGKTFGKLTVLEKVTDNLGRDFWYCSCTNPGEDKPHNYVTLPTGRLLSPNGPRSCGCLDNATAAEFLQYYPELRDIMFNAYYYYINGSCNDPGNYEYYTYGGHGIKNEYLSFDEFVKYHKQDFIRAYDVYRYDIFPDTIVNTANFGPNNTQFITSKFKNENHKPEKDWYVFANQLWTIDMLNDLAREYYKNPLSPEIIKERIDAGWDIYTAITSGALEKNKIIKPIVDMSTIKRIHSNSLGLMNNSPDYLFNNMTENITPQDKDKIAEDNVRRRDKGLKF